jgi:hypothetical protein
LVAFNKFNLTVQNMARGNLLLNADTLKLALIVAAGTPVAADDEFADVSADEVAAGNGYTATGNSGGAGITSNAAGTETMRTTSAIPVWTASAAGFSFRYPVLYDDTSTNDKLLGWWDYGSTLTLSGANGDTFTALGLDTSWATLV